MKRLNTCRINDEYYTFNVFNYCFSYPNTVQIYWALSVTPQSKLHWGVLSIEEFTLHKSLCSNTLLEHTYMLTLISTNLQ